MVALQEIHIHAPLVIAEGAIFLVVCPVMVFLRFYSRRITGSSFGLDDWAIAAALLFVIAMAITLLIQTSMKELGYAFSKGYAKPGHPDPNVARWPAQLIQVPALGCIKLSFLFLYRRVFTNRVAGRFSWLNWFMIAIICMWTIGFLFTLLFPCGTNIKAYWANFATERKECVPGKTIDLGYAVSDVITDVLTILLPIPEIWKLHMPIRRKLAITGVFGLGVVTVVMSVLRMVVYYAALKLEFNHNGDFEYIVTLESYFSLLEAGLGLCAACLPVQYGLLHSKKVRSIFQSVFSLATLGSRESQRSQASRRSNARSYRLRDPILEFSEIVSPLPTHAAAAAGYDPSLSELEMKHLQSERGIMVTKSFAAEEQIV